VRCHEGNFLFMVLDEKMPKVLREKTGHLNIFNDGFLYLALIRAVVRVRHGKRPPFPRVSRAGARWRCAPEQRQ
jgi:hypothetical protein